MPSQKPSSSFSLLAALRHWASGRAAARHQRLELARMSDRELNDLGIGRSEVQEWSRRRVPAMRAGASNDAEARPSAPRSRLPCAAGGRPAALA